MRLSPGASYRSHGPALGPLPGLILGLLLGFCGLLLGACGGPDVEQAEICARLIPALANPTAGERTVEIVRQIADYRAVTVHYRATGPSGRTGAHWITCRFAGQGLQQDRLRLTEIATDRQGELSAIQVYMLRQYWLGRYEPQAQARERVEERPQEAVGPEAEPTTGRVFYLLQLALHAATLGCLYGLVAIGYTLVYGIIGRINLAFGEIAMVGAYATFLGVAVLAVLGASPLPLVLALVLLVAAAIGAVHGFVTQRVVFRPLRHARSQAPLIATVGLAILLQEYLRLTQGSGDRWIQPVFSAAHELAEGDGFVLALSTTQILILVLVPCLYGGLWLVMWQSRFGRTVRACADDIDMAALCGVDVDRTIALTFVVGSAYAAIAGFVILLRYGGVSFHDGYLLGFKALTAAIIGGIGSVPGAMLGGLVIGFWETFWAGYLTIAYRDVALFGLLAVTLIWRPGGLLGHTEPIPYQR